MTHATPPIALGSFLPFTGLPITNDVGLVLGGKYFAFSDAGSVSSKAFDACVEVMEHQGASSKHHESCLPHQRYAVETDLSQVRASPVGLLLQLASFFLF